MGLLKENRQTTISLTPQVKKRLKKFWRLHCDTNIKSYSDLLNQLVDYILEKEKLSLEVEPEEVEKETEEEEDTEETEQEEEEPEEEEEEEEEEEPEPEKPKPKPTPLYRNPYLSPYKLPKQPFDFRFTGKY